MCKHSNVFSLPVLTSRLAWSPPSDPPLRCGAGRVRWCDHSSKSRSNGLSVIRSNRSSAIQSKFLVVIAFGTHPFPFRTRPLSRPRRWYCGSFHGRVGRRQDPNTRGPSARTGLFRFPAPASRLCLDALLGEGTQFLELIEGGTRMGSQDGSSCPQDGSSCPRSRATRAVPAAAGSGEPTTCPCLVRPAGRTPRPMRPSPAHGEPRLAAVRERRLRRLSEVGSEGSCEGAEASMERGGGALSMSPNGCRSQAGKKGVQGPGNEPVFLVGRASCS